MAKSKFLPFRDEKFRFSEHSRLWWHLSRIGTSPQLGSFKCTNERKAFSPSRGRKKIIPQNLADLAVRSFLLSSLQALFFFFFAVEQERSKPNLSYKKQDSDGYKESDQEQLRHHTPSHLPHPCMCFTENNKNNKSTKYNS